MSIFLSVNS